MTVYQRLQKGEEDALKAYVEADRRSDEDTAKSLLLHLCTQFLVEHVGSYSSHMKLNLVSSNAHSFANSVSSNRRSHSKVQSELDH